MPVWSVGVADATAAVGRLIHNARYHREAYDEATGTWQVTCYTSERFPVDGEVVTSVSDEDLDGATLEWRAYRDAEGRSVVRVSEHLAPRASRLWYVAIPHDDHDPPTCDLVAFDTDHLPADRVIDDPTFMLLPVRAAQQVAAVRWFPSTGVVDQVYVGKDRRRLHLATKALAATSAYHQHRGWTGVLRGDGRRTRLGELFATNVGIPQRVPAWTEYHRPMDRVNRAEEGAAEREPPAGDQPTQGGS